MTKPAFFFWLFLGPLFSTGQSVIIPDDFPLTPQMLRANRQDKAYVGVVAHDMVWFTNDTLDQTLIVELKLDVHRWHISLFNNHSMPGSLLSRLPLQEVRTREIATQKAKLTFVKEVVKRTRRIGQLYFVSLKGVRLGDEKSKLLSFYGEPTQCTDLKETQKCSWDFAGEINTTSITDDRPLARRSYGYHVEAFFKNDLLVAIMLTNDVP